jgi:hypothetical protein
MSRSMAQNRPYHKIPQAKLIDLPVILPLQRQYQTPPWLLNSGSMDFTSFTRSGTIYLTY